MFTHGIGLSLRCKHLPIYSLWRLCFSVIFSFFPPGKNGKKNITNSCWFSYVYSFPSLFSFFYEKRKGGGGKGKEILAIT